MTLLIPKVGRGRILEDSLSYFKSVSRFNKIASFYSTAQQKSFDKEEGHNFAEPKKRRLQLQGYSQGPNNNSSRSKWGSGQEHFLLYRKYIGPLLKWSPLPLVGLLLLGYGHWRSVVRQIESENPTLAKDWEIKLYSKVPLRSFSRTWGWINNVDLPLWTREPIFNWYAKKFGCDIQEAASPDLKNYKNLGEFFRRELKEGIRPIDQKSPLVSPADGTILHLGKLDMSSGCGWIEQVKGVTYSLTEFLGVPTWDSKSKNSKYILEDKYCSQIMQNPGENRLFSVVIYLAPGDYHRFHSPVNWQVSFRRHFSGELMSVNPTVAKWVRGLFSLNERAVYYGTWEHGFFSMTAIGATNVGSIRVYQDPELHTNIFSMKKRTSMDKRFRSPLRFQKGSPFGEFNMGSTIVLIFEAPENFNLSATTPPGEKTKFGETLSSVKSQS